MREDLKMDKKYSVEEVQDQNEKIIPEILKETSRSHNKFGVQDRHPLEWLAILSEEHGEASKEVVEYSMAGSIEALVNLRTELIQVAAVAINFISSLDRNEFQEYKDTITHYLNFKNDD